MRKASREATSFAIDLDDVRRAAARLRGVAHRTPVVTSRTVDQLVGARVFFKCENLQRGGAFKFRGAYNRLADLSPDERARGIVAFSSGNHAQGVALAARELGIPATVVMPDDAPPLKVEGTRGYGAEIVTYARLTEDREAIARRLADERGLTLVPPYNHELIMAGQGTAALELLEEVQTLDWLLMPVGGGGLLSGSVIAATGLLPEIKVVGVETVTSDDWVQSLTIGHPVHIPPPETIADGIRTQEPGSLTFPIVQALGHGVMTVSDDEVKDAMRFMLLRLKLLVEPTGAVPVALLLSGRLDVRNQRVGVILSGGNADPGVLAEVLIARG
ncbi:MAG: pyridoxal-phosphate dependent enzyme [Chloroflexi bacterium]|nr:pyridoxal-phosphate dependent enzyme [Chloroflexota bacterium]MBV9603010.1 pyridoxal-phosphate dependent enzyme [Chloroflexota bacterium]